MPLGQRQCICLVIATVLIAVFVYILYLPRLSSWLRSVNTGGTDNKSNAQRVNSSTMNSQQGNSKCLYYSPSYPSAGGRGCSSKCTETVDGQRNSSHVAAFYHIDQVWPKDLIDNMHLAASILKKYGTPSSLDTEQNLYLHVVFDYYCCYTPKEARLIGEFLDTHYLWIHGWIRHEVHFDQIVCAIYGTGDMVELILTVDEKSQKSLTEWALEVAKDLEKRLSVHKHIPRDRLQGFHMTLATVNQSMFPVQPALKEVNTVIPPGKWHSSPVLLHKPLCGTCEGNQSP